MKNLYFILFIAFSTFGFAQIPSNYYTPANGLTGYTLKSKLKEIINSSNNGLSPEYIHNDQGDNLDGLYNTSDKDSYYENDNTILDMYSENPTGTDPYNYNYNSDECGNYSGEGDCYNKEHIIPQSIFGNASPMVDDAHHVVPTDGRVNGFRGTYPFGVVNNSQLISQSSISNPTMNGSKAGSNLNSGYSAGYTNTVFEPIDEFKGDIARIYFYFATRYEDQITSWGGYAMFDGNNNNKAIADPFLSILMTWHQNDPVSQKEIDRNNAIFNYQNNRNPFVDHPEYVAQIWNVTADTDAPTAPTMLVASNPTDNTISLTWNAATDNIGVTSYDIYVDTVNTFNTTGTSFTATGLSPNTNYCFTVKAKDAAGNESVFSNQDCETTTNNGSSGSNCADEDFESIPANSSSYSDRSWAGTNGTWNATRGRTDQTINTRAITIDCRNSSNGTLTSPTVAGGIGSLTITTQRKFTGTDGTLDVLVNGTNAGTIAYSGTQQTVTIPNINVTGNVQVVIQDNDSGSARVGLDDLSWTCYSGLSVNEFEIDGFKLYPNPSQNFVTIDLKNNTKTTVEVYNILGAKVLNKTIYKTEKLNLSHLKSGIYILKLEQDGNSVTRRLVKR